MVVKSVGCHENLTTFPQDKSLNGPHDFKEMIVVSAKFTDLAKKLLTLHHSLIKPPSCLSIPVLNTPYLGKGLLDIAGKHINSFQAQTQFVSSWKCCNFTK